MKQRIISIFAVVVLVIGLSLLLYPTVSNYYQSVNHRHAIFSYLSTVETLSDDEYDHILAAAEEYNDKLANHQQGSIMSLTDEQLQEYYSMLDIDGSGMMGYINIDKLDIYLPIYHGTSEPVLQEGVGHIEGSSLPVGGETAHSLLSGHRGLPSAKLFTDLDKLEIGDRFTIHVLNEFYTYEVDQINIVEPNEVNSLAIESGHDYCTLITCTPYGVNTQRMLIRGKRIYTSVSEEKMAIQSGARMIDTIYVIAVIEVPVLIFSVLISTYTYRKSNNKTYKREGEHS